MKDLGMKYYNQAAHISIYITNLGMYNEGVLLGGWVSLPVTESDLDRIFADVTDDFHEEVFISDFECDCGLNIGEYSGIRELNELASELEDLDADQIKVFRAMVGNWGYEPEDAIEKIDDSYIWQNCSTMTEVAEQYLDESGMLDELPEWAQGYIDYESYGRDMEIEGRFTPTDDGMSMIEIR